MGNEYIGNVDLSMKKAKKPRGKQKITFQNQLPKYETFAEKTVVVETC